MCENEKFWKHFTQPFSEMSQNLNKHDIQLRTVVIVNNMPSAFVLKLWV